MPADLLERGYDLKKDAKILVLGAGGLIGGKIVERLRADGYTSVVSCNHSQLDLTVQAAVQAYFAKEQPEYVFFCAVKSITDFNAGTVGDADELSENCMMVCNTMECCKDFHVRKAVFLGSAMLYPWNLEPYPEQLTEDMLESYNLQGYSKPMESAVLSKLLAYKLCQFYRCQYGCDFVYCLPTHIYGGFFGRKNFYFTERMVMDMCAAKHEGASELYLDVFGRGVAKKNLLHVEDCADAIIAVMERYDGKAAAVNIASDEVVSWCIIVELLREITGYQGKIRFNTERKENLTPRLCSCEKIKALGWRPRYDMAKGLRELCAEYMAMKGWEEE